ncbi:MAG: hypothetical protein OEZ47_17015 [Gammaproteobacteria bacterium]|nr:hypothetical protein [Gammaproteobacteria bacterium]
MYIYLHGLNSSSNSYKVNWLRPRVSPREMLSPTYPAHDAALAIPALTKLVENNIDKKPLVLIGSSLGGYYAQYLAQIYPCGIIFINPALLPSHELEKHKGLQTNYDGSQYELTDAHLEKLEQLRVHSANPAIPSLLLVDEDDEVIDPKFAIQYLQGQAAMRIFPGGSHSFEHLEHALDDIVRFHDKLV